MTDGVNTEISPHLSVETHFVILLVCSLLHRDGIILLYDCHEEVSVCLYVLDLLAVWPASQLSILNVKHFNVAFFLRGMSNFV